MSPLRDKLGNEMEYTMNIGDICTYQRGDQSWGFFWIIGIDEAPNWKERIFSLRKFDASTQEEVLAEHTEDIAELVTLKLLGHFPIVESRVLEVEPRVLSAMLVSEEALEGYRIWREAFDQGQAGAFTLALEEI
jgi:hypothetical protein